MIDFVTNGINGHLEGKYFKERKRPERFKADKQKDKRLLIKQEMIRKDEEADAEENANLNAKALGREYHDNKIEQTEKAENQESLQRIAVLEKQIGVKLPETRKKLEEQKKKLEQKQFLEKSDEVSGRETGPAEKGKAEANKRTIK